MRYASKADWAQAKKEEVDKRIDALATPYIPSSKWQRIRRREQVLSELRSERAKFQMLEQRYRASGE